jgi:hypothetical protein
VPRLKRPQLRASLSRRLTGALSAHLLYKASALFLALVRWLAVSAEQPTEVTVPVQLVLEHDSAIVLATRPPELRALVAGQARDVNRLFSDLPEVRRSVPGDVGDSVRFEFTRDDVLPPPGFDGPLQVRSVSPSVVTLRLTTRVMRRVPVRSRVRVTLDSLLRATGPAVLTPDSVTIIGTQDRVRAVSAIFTEPVDVPVRDSLSEVVPLDTVGLGVEVEPAFVRVRVPVTRDTLFQLRPLLPQTRPRVRPP